MTNMELVCLIVIGDRKKKLTFLKALEDKRLSAPHIFYGRGFMRNSALLESLGLVVDNEKVIIMSLASRARGNEAVEMFEEEFEFKKPGTGIAFTVEMDKLVF